MEIIYNIKWNWEDMCGPDGLQPWNERTHDIGLCFQELVLNIPILFMLATISGYYVNLRVDFVTRGKIQEVSIRIRSILVLFLAFVPIIKIYAFITEDSSKLFAIDYFLCAAECLTWFVHFGYTLALKNRLGINPRGPILILFCWSLLVVLNIMLLRSRILLGLPYGYNIAVIVIQFFYSLTLIPSAGECSPTFYSPCLVGSQISQFGEHLPLLHSEEIGMLGTAMQGVNPLSKLFFYWVEPLFHRGLEKKLRHADDLFDLPPEYKSSYISHYIDKALIGNRDKYQTSDNEIRTNTYQGYGATEQTTAGSSLRPIIFPPVIVIKPIKRHNVSLLRALHSCFGVRFYAIGILKFITDMTNFAGPILLNKLVQFIQDNNIELKYGYYYAAGLLLSTIISAFCNAHFNMQMALIGLKMRTAIITTVFRKILSVTSTELHKSFTVGEITNFMSTDTDRIVNSCPSFHALWSIPLQMIFTLYLLYNQVGLAFMAGIAFTLILIPINKAIAQKIGNLSKDLMNQKDKRISLMSEIIKGIRCIKLYVWEDYFIQQIANVRWKELIYLGGRKYLDALCVFFWATTPILIATLTLSTYVLLGNQLDAATVFTSVALINMLIAPLNAFPWVLNGLTEAWVSLKRIQKLLEVSDLNEDLYYSQITTHEKDDHAIVLRNATFSWVHTSSSKPLHAIVKTKKNKGKGKKSKQKGNIQRRDSSPDPSNDENESLIQPFSLININLRIETGHLVGIIGRVGSGKTSLLNAILAEMLKQDGEVAVSDNINGYGYVSQEPWLQRGSVKDNILFGKAYEESKYRSVIDACGLSDDLMMLDKAAVGESGCTLSGGQKVRIALARAVYQDKQVYLLDDVLSAVDVKVAQHIFTKCIMGLLRYKTKILVTHSLRFLTNASVVIQMENGCIRKQGRPDVVLDETDEDLEINTDLSVKNILTESSLETLHHDNASLKDDGSTNNIMDEEHMATGNVKLSVLGLYLKSIGVFLSIAILLSLTLMQLSQNFTFIWLSFWVSSEKPSPINITNTLRVNQPTRLESDNNYYLWVYVGLVGINCLLTLLRAFLFAYGGVLAASKIHKNVLKVIIKARVRFFDITPSGRILNRFSSDIFTVDDSLPFIFNILLAQIFGLLGALVVCLYGLPWLCLVLAPLLPIYLWLQNQYRCLSQHLKRLQTVTLSPIYSYFNDILQGLTTIRAFRASSRCLCEGEELVDTSQRASLASAAAAQWLTLRLQMMGVAVVAGAALVTVAKRHFDTIDPGMVGLAISYALSLTSFLSGVMNAFPETERELVSVERLGEYLNQVELEDVHDVFASDTSSPLLYGWPTQGVVSFKNVVMKYRDHLPPALKGITFESRPAEKIGVVGRTGAGKSSLFSALLRLSEIQKGSILIDQVDISKLALNALRSRIAIIPQEPFVFEGSVLENIDPLQQYSESELWVALERCGARDSIVARGGLQTNAGQLARGLMQQLCLVRALLHNAKILCIDEATANIDYETDRLIQATIRNSFKQSTVITIAHRISTILDSDRVLVIGDGQVLEFDAPDVLLQDSYSHFSQLINQEPDC